MICRRTPLTTVAAFCATTAAAQSVGEITNPDWIAQPTAQQASAAYPFRAMANEKIGVAVVRCTAAADGRLTSCALVCETPAGWQFGKAAVRLARFYRLHPNLPDGRSVMGEQVILPLFFNPPFLQRLPRCDG